MPIVPEVKRCENKQLNLEFKWINISMILIYQMVRRKQLVNIPVGFFELFGI